MLEIVLWVSLVVIYCTYWILKWRKPKCNGVLPPGSMGLPLIGESLKLLSPSYSLDVHSFIRNGLQRYGLIYKSSLFSQSVVISADQEFNTYLLNQEGRLVELWYTDASKILIAEENINAAGYIHKHTRSLLLKFLGWEPLKEKVLPQLQNLLDKTMSSWATQENVDVKHAFSSVYSEFTANILFGYDLEKSAGALSGCFTIMKKALLSFPLNIPGSTYHQGLKSREKLLKIFEKAVKDRINSVEKPRDDALDQALREMEKEKFLTEEFIQFMFLGVTFASFPAASLAVTLLFHFLESHPAVLAELMIEHENILKSRQGSDSSLTWDEYKSMTFTHQVINEILRLGSDIPGLFRKAIKDIQYKGYTIPAGWNILMVINVLHLNPDVYKDPLEFNPWRWKNMDSYTISKNFSPFGGGTRQCVGAEYAKLTLATFIHLLITKYRWKIIKQGRIRRNPMLEFIGGLHVKFAKKEKDVI